MFPGGAIGMLFSSLPGSDTREGGRVVLAHKPGTRANQAEDLKAVLGQTTTWVGGEDAA